MPREPKDGGRVLHVAIGADEAAALEEYQQLVGADNVSAAVRLAIVDAWTWARHAVDAPPPEDAWTDHAGAMLQKRRPPTSADTLPAGWVTCPACGGAGRPTKADGRLDMARECQLCGRTGKVPSATGGPSDGPIENPAP